MTPYLSSIYLFSGNFAINGFQLCNGQILPISQYTALFSLIGTYYGGNGTSNFQLPDLRGRTPIHQGQGPGLSSYVLGEVTGTEYETMLYSNMPAHTHLVNAIGQSGSSPLPGGNYISEVKTGSGPHAQTDFFYNAGPVNVTLNPLACTAAGSGGPFSIQQPVLCLTAMIAMTGIYPARN